MPSTSQSYVALSVKPTSNTLLPTALIKIKDRYGNALVARALLDSCSQHCLITEEFSRKLKLEETPTFLSVQGIGSSQSVSTKTIRSEVCSRSPKISGFRETMQFFVLPKLTLQLPSSSFHPSPMSLPDSALLADPYFYESKRIDVVIGAEYYSDLLKNERRKVTKNGPMLHNSVFGWIVSGRVVESPQIVSHTPVCSSSNYRNSSSGSKSWKNVTLQTPTPLKNRCLYEPTVRNEVERFIVARPKNESDLYIPPSVESSAIRITQVHAFIEPSSIGGAPSCRSIPSRALVKVELLISGT
ncbi:uncharacterized protein LOC129737976 [Uranotaenia lowii]|uniref:uncharacterized protein LOC129737976 n=1 Tax=Uranotaenia lowii TaxID=190385 RepID=UPI002479D164|nr:uncharacterized protein LOC129737976 [Uranotaenia lowii]